MQEITPAPDNAEIVLVSGNDGHAWEFVADAGDYECGDLARLTMWTQGNKYPQDDVCVYAENVSANNADTVR